jgi:hypothetical protein
MGDVSMGSTLARLGFGAILAISLALSAVGAVAAAGPTGTWVTIFASHRLAPGTFPVGSYDYLYTLHTTWTLPAPSGNEYDQFPVGGPYTVDRAAPRHPGDALIRVGIIEAARSLNPSRTPPTCVEVSSINPRQATRIVVVEASEAGITRATWNHEVATWKLTAKLIDVAGGKTLSLRPIRTEALTGDVFTAVCQRRLLG